jgi:hypothetical protein
MLFTGLGGCYLVIFFVVNMLFLPNVNARQRLWVWRCCRSLYLCKSAGLFYPQICADFFSHGKMQ